MNSIKKMKVVRARIYLDEVIEKGDSNEYGPGGGIVYKDAQWNIIRIDGVGATKRGRAYMEMILEFNRKVRGIEA